MAAPPSSSQPARLVPPLREPPASPSRFPANETRLMTAQHHINAQPSLLRSGRNCSALANASRAAVLVDGAAYFTSLDTALKRARRSIFILGWDFDGRIALRPDAGEEAQSLGALLRSRVEANPELHVYILVWSVSVLHGPSAIAPNLLGADWDQHPRIHFRLDTRHPFYAAHHGKIVCVDGQLAFVGGIDLTVRRWDSSDHRPDCAERCDPDGKAYAPVHDMQMLVDGEAAATLCGMARERWRLATGESCEASAAHCGEHDAWPKGLEPDFTNVPVAVARTIPDYDGHDEVAECAQLTLDMIATARQAIYIEAQYLTAPLICAALQRRLREPSGPDVVIILTYESRGLMERFAMGANRDRMLRRLARADRGGRLRVFYPVTPSDDGEEQILTHAKLVIIDDHVVRIGSSNLNNRSIALDTECDLAIEARSEAERAAVAAVRNRLVAEHLGVTALDVERALAESGSLARAIDRLNTGGRGLRPFPALSEDGPDRPLLLTALLDPARPLRLKRFLSDRAPRILSPRAG